MSVSGRTKIWPWVALLVGVPAAALSVWLYVSSSEGAAGPEGRSRRRTGGGAAGGGGAAAGEEGRVLATGAVRPQVGAEVKVGTRISGQVDRVYVDIGDRVKPEAMLAELEKEELEAGASKARASLAAARAKLALLRKGARTEEIDAAEAAVAQAKAVVDAARLELRRKRALLEKKLIAEEQVDAAKRDVQVAEAKLAAAKSALAVKRKLYLPEEVALARARVAEAKAAYDMAKVRLGYADIRSPIGGVVAEVNIQSGETVSSGLRAPTLVTVIDLTKLQVEAYVDEVDIGRVEVGRKASFTVDTFPEEEFSGRVKAIYPKAVLRDNVVNYLAIISFSNPGGRLRPGMTANVTIETSGPDDARAEKKSALAEPTADEPTGETGTGERPK
jgi:multidrug resistance efflux pump